MAIRTIDDYLLAMKTSFEPTAAARFADIMRPVGDMRVGRPLLRRDREHCPDWERSAGLAQQIEEVAIVIGDGFDVIVDAVETEVAHETDGSLHNARAHL